MNEKMKILVAYDGSENADGAVEDLKNAGLPKIAEVLVLSLADVFLPPSLSEEINDTFPINIPVSVKLAQERAERKVKAAEAMAARASERLETVFPEWQVRHQALAESPAWGIIRKAEEWEADLIVVGARGHSDLGGRLILGSVSQRVLYEAKCSVRVARPRRTEIGPSPRLLVGVDNSAHSDAAVDAVCRRQWPAGTEVRLLAVVDNLMAVNPSTGQPSDVRWIEVGDEDNWAEVRQIFDPSAEKLRAGGLDAAVMIRRGNPKDEIVEEAESWGADCVFLGAKGVRGIDRLLLGSVSSAVSARALCSVEVVRPKTN